MQVLLIGTGASKYMYNKILPRLASSIRTPVLVLILFAMPASTQYSIIDYNFGGGSASSSSNSYGGNLSTGEITSPQLSGTTYDAWPGITYTLLAATPPAPTLVNSGSYYNQLDLTLASAHAAEASDTEFAIGVSPDSFTTTYYLQADGTLTDTLTDAEWQTYTAWGGASGTTLTGLLPNTTYTVKVKARQGIFSESPWGPTDTASTSTLSVSFDIDVASADNETSPPYELTIDQLSADSVTTSSEFVWVDISTNAQNGATVYIQGTTGGLSSATTGHTITSVSDDLANQAEAVGIQATSTTQSSGGPLTAVSPYNGAGATVGLIPQQLESIFSSSTAITSGRGSFALKAKVSGLTPAAADYSETLTVVAVPSF